RQIDSTSGSHGARPLKSPSQPMRFPLTPPDSDSANGAAGPSIDSGTLKSWPAMIDSNSAVSATVRPIGPTTPIEGIHWSGVLGTRPTLVRKPQTLFQPAGLRRLPPKSLPSASGTMRSASATAAPPELPPAVRSEFQALRVTPKTALNVFEPSPNS